MVTSPTDLRFTDDMVDEHLDNVLRASGSALRHYSMQKTLDDMRAAVRTAMAAAVEAAFSSKGLV